MLIKIPYRLYNNVLLRLASVEFIHGRDFNTITGTSIDHFFIVFINPDAYTLFLEQYGREV